MKIGNRNNTHPEPEKTVCHHIPDSVLSMRYRFTVKKYVSQFFIKEIIETALESASIQDTSDEIE